MLYHLSRSNYHMSSGSKNWSFYLKSTFTGFLVHLSKLRSALTDMYKKQVYYNKFQT